jgi:hypothetical protein
MNAAIVAALLALNPSPPPGKQDPFRGSGESPKLNHTSSGFTLDKLQGMPMTRPVYSPPQPQVWYVQPYPVYPTPGLGGYLPPGTGRSYSPLSIGLGWGGWWW